MRVRAKERRDFPCADRPDSDGRTVTDRMFNACTTATVRKFYFSRASEQVTSSPMATRWKQCLPRSMPHGIIGGMTLKIDKAGRIVLPKPLRDRLRLHPGASLDVEESAEGVLLRPLKRRASLVERDGLLVHLGRLPAGFDWNRTVEEMREERIREVAGR